MSEIKELPPDILGDIDFEEKYTNSDQEQHDKETTDRLIEAALEGKLNLLIFKVFPCNPEHCLEAC